MKKIFLLLPVLFFMTSAFADDEANCKNSGGIYQNQSCVCDAFRGLQTSSSDKTKCECISKDKDYDSDTKACLARAKTITYNRRGWAMPKPTEDVFSCIEERKDYFEGMLCCRAQNKSEVVYIGGNENGKCVCRKAGSICMPYEDNYIWEGLFCQSATNEQLANLKNELSKIDNAQQILCDIGRTDLLIDPTSCPSVSTDRAVNEINIDSENKNKDTFGGGDTEKVKKIVADLDQKAANFKRSDWKNEEGKFNTARLISDSVAGVVLGTAGGLITSSVVKKSQVKSGFEDLNCAIGGQVVAGWGDEFLVGIQ